MQKENGTPSLKRQASEASFPRSGFVLGKLMRKVFQDNRQFSIAKIYEYIKSIFNSHKEKRDRKGKKVPIIYGSMLEILAWVGRNCFL